MLSEILSGVGDVLSAPRRALWGGLGLGDNGGDLMEKMGVDRDSTLGNIGGFASEMLLDPINLLGLAGGGALAGRLLGRGAGAAAPLARAIGGADEAAGIGGRLARMAGSGLDEAAEAATGRIARSPAAMTPYLSDVGASAATLGEGTSPLKGLANSRYLDDLAGGAETVADRVRPGLGAGLESATDPMADFLSMRGPAMAEARYMRPPMESPFAGMTPLHLTADPNAPAMSSGMSSRLARMIGG